MNVIIDIGNTISKLFLFDGDILKDHKSEVGHSLEIIPRLLSDSSSSWKGVTFEAAIVSSVVDLPEEAEEHLRLFSCPLIRFTSETPIPIQNNYRTPQTLGSDRLAAAVGAWSQHPDHNLLIIDAGSCITFDLVSSEGAYSGGNISPGLHARLRAIDDYFPRLPLVEAEGATPDMGYDTETAIRSGVIVGMQHEIEGYVRHFKAKYPDLLVFLTGGDDINFATTIKNTIFADHFLVPRGLNCILRHVRKLKLEQE
ncbi:MAG: type III pantothenate kinase [Bacteroidaceae bacterium]|nr:type III pantothenate kinase [Bacteroidaceae bacterium]